MWSAIVWGACIALWGTAHGFSSAGLKANPQSRDTSLSTTLLQSLFETIRGTDALRARQDAKDQLLALTKQVQPNGLVATPAQRETLAGAVSRVERYNPTRSPATSPLMAGFWRLLYSDFDPPAPSSGKLGPFVGSVYQDLDPKAGVGRNMISVAFPPIRGSLTVNTRVKDPNTWEIDFDYTVGFKTRSAKFEPRKEVRLWKITYLDENLRILRGRRPETSENEAFIFVLSRAEAERFSISS